MNRTFVYNLPLVVVLTGCVSSYVPPAPSASTARLRILEIGGENTTIQKLKEPCINTDKNAQFFGSHFEQIANFSRVSDSSDLRRLNMPDPPADKIKFTEITVEAGKPFHLGYRANRFVSGYPQSTVYTCWRALSFRPVAGTDYEAVITSSDIQRCDLTIKQMTPSQGKYARVAVAESTRIIAACQ